MPSYERAQANGVAAATESEIIENGERARKCVYWQSGAADEY